MAVTKRLGPLTLAMTAALVLAGCTGSSEAPTTKPTATKTSAKPKATIELADAALVTNPNGSATLSATIVNHTDEEQEFTGYTIKRDGVAVRTRSFHLSAYSNVGAGKSVTIGTTRSTQIQVDDKTSVGQSLAVELNFGLFDHRGEPIVVRANVPVVERTVEDDAVVGAKFNPHISVEGGKVVVIAGQKRAYIGGTVVSTVDDSSWELPAAVDPDGNPVKYRHQTATGGPYGITAVKGRRMALGGPPFTPTEGDADYINANDVKIGEKLTVTIPFESGNVEAVFTVVAG
jgi:hypothetical protein